MKIVRIIARLNVGGPARHVALLNAGLEARGHDTRLVYGALEPGEASLEAPAVASGIPMVKARHLGRRIRPWGDLLALVSLTALVFREQPDVVHTHTAKAGTLGRLAALAFNATRSRSRRALVVHTFHGHVFEGYFTGHISRIVRLAEHVLARFTDVIVTISPRQWADIVERFMIAPAAKTAVVPLGLDLAALLTLQSGAPGMRAAIGALASDVVVGYAGRIVPVKDVPTLLRAFAAALRQQAHLRLVVAGDGTERQEAEALASTLGIAGRVHFVGWVTDLPRFYATLDMFVLSSLNEGTPVAAIEAMAAGLPVAATSVGGVPDVVDAGVTGTLVPPRDPEALAAALVALAGAPDTRRRMGLAGRARASERYGQERLVTDIEQLYARALARTRR